MGTNAPKGSGTATITPVTTGTGQKLDYTITYTAVGTLDGGSVAVGLPNITDWSMDAADTSVTPNVQYNANTIIVTTNGVLAETTSPATPIVYSAVVGTPAVQVSFKTLSPGQYVRFVLKAVTAPVAIP